MKRCWILLFSVLIICFCNGCAATDSSNTSLGNSLTITEFPKNEESSVTPTNLPKSTSTPTPTVTPTPSPTPSVLEQIEQYETDPEAVITYPVNAALLVNVNKNEVLYSYHGTEAIYPASITKLLTALTAFDLTEEQELQQMVTVSQTATTAVIPSAKMCGFQAGDQISLQSLLACMLIYSGNDSSVAVAEHLLGTEDAFVTAMNQKVQELGGISSNFCNTHGLPDDNHKTSAYYKTNLMCQFILRKSSHFLIIECYVLILISCTGMIKY